MRLRTLAGDPLVPAGVHSLDQPGYGEVRPGKTCTHKAERRYQQQGQMRQTTVDKKNITGMDY